MKMSKLALFQFQRSMVKSGASRSGHWSRVVQAVAKYRTPPRYLWTDNKKGGKGEEKRGERSREMKEKETKGEE
jgi:hypothetical protein